MPRVPIVFFDALKRVPMLAQVLALLLALLLAGCAGGGRQQPASLPPTNQAPAGLAIRAEVHVQGPQAAQQFTPGVYLLEPDGTLRYAPPQPRTADQPMPPEPVYPRIVRRVPTSEVDRLWRLVGPTSLADPRNPERIPPGEDWSPPPGRSVALLDIRDSNGSRRFAVTLTGATPAARDARPLLERLQALAWRTPQPSAAR